MPSLFGEKEMSVTLRRLNASQRKATKNYPKWRADRSETRLHAKTRTHFNMLFLPPLFVSLPSFLNTLHVEYCKCNLFKDVFLFLAQPGWVMITSFHIHFYLTCHLMVTQS